MTWLAGQLLPRRDRRNPDLLEGAQRRGSEDGAWAVGLSPLPREAGVGGWRRTFYKLPRSAETEGSEQHEESCEQPSQPNPIPSAPSTSVSITLKNPQLNQLLDIAGRRSLRYFGDPDILPGIHATVEAIWTFIQHAVDDFYRIQMYAPRANCDGTADAEKHPVPIKQFLMRELLTITIRLINNH